MEKERVQYDSHDDQLYKTFIKKFREQNVPERYNQILLLDELNNPFIDHFISISNRTDGKSINYIHALMKIAIDYELGITFLTRNMRLRESYQTLIDEIIELSDLFERKDFTFIRSQYYTTLNYKGQSIGLISDLNNASELKYYSNYMKKFPIIVYDEFLTLESDYLPDEWERLYTIYKSIDRKEEYPLITKPKIFYFGNAVNFSSPILAGLKIFNILEVHKINTTAIYKYDFNVMLEMRRNDNANEQMNTRAFGDLEGSMTTGEFETNSFNIATQNDLQRIKKNPRTIYVKLSREYLKIFFNRETFDIVLSIENNIESSYQYNFLLKDNKDDSIYLNEKYYSENHIKKFDRGAYLFENNFSKNFITSNANEMNHLKINKLIREYLKNETEHDELKNKEEQFKINYIEQTKRGLMNKFWE